MKRKLFFLICALVSVCTTAFAWEKPAAPASQPLATDGQTEQYLYNVGTGGFLVGGNQYTTRASVSANAGYKFKVEMVDETGPFYTLTDYVETKSEWMTMFCPSVNEIWVDNNDGANNRTWTILFGSGNSFQISNAAFDGELFGVRSSETEDTRCYFASAYPEETLATEWYAVSVEDYQSYIAAVKAYEASVKLKAALDAAKAKYPSIDFSAVEAVYNNPNATADELTAAVDNLNVIAREALAASATWAAPVDFTDFVDNMSFETGSLGKWTAPTSDDTGVKPNSNATYTTNGIDGDYLFNTWGGKAELKVSQKVENVPNGIYKLTALYASDANNVGMLFANNDTLNITASPEGKGQFVEATLIAAVVDNTLNIGMTSKDWFKTDHFRLTYCGNDAEGAKEYFLASVPQFDPEAQISESVLEAYNNAVEAANAGVNNAEDAVAAIAEIKVAAVAVDENMAAWTEYQNKLQVAYATLQDESLDNTATAVGILSDYYDNSLDIINDKQLTTEELKAELAKLDEMINAAMQCLKSGADFTRYLKNPEMDAAAGWNGNPTINEKCGEKYASGEFDVYQVVEADVPVGLYEISMQGFYREYRDDNADKVAWYNVFEATEDAHTYKAGCPKPIAWVYMNTNKTALNCVYDYTREGVYDADSKEFTCDFYGSGFSVDPYNKYAYPNNMATAAKAFADGAYKKEAYGLVAKAGDKLRIGVKGNLGGSDWAIFDNFKLTYRAKDAAIINKLLPDAKASLDLTDKQVGKDVKEAVNAAITAAESASSVDEKFDALAKCFELGETIDASVAKFKALDIALGELEAAINEAEYIGVAENTKTAAGALLKNAFEGLNGGYTDAEAEAALVQIEEMIKQLQLPEFIGSDDNPVSFTGFIKNADLEGLTVKNDKFGAWTWKKSGGNGPMFPYGAASSTAAEFWAGSAADLQFSLTQEVTGLPAGKYALYAYAGNGYDNQASLGNAGRAYLFVETPGKTEIPSVAVEPSTDPASAGNQQYKVIFTVEEGDVVTLGFKSAGTMDARWFWCDTFSLECYGTNSKQTDTPDAISGALAIKDVEQNETVATPVAIFNVAGVKTPTLSKGLNIIRMSDGKTRKVMVK